MISNHGLTLELTEFNGVKALERRGFFVFWVHSKFCGVFVCLGFFKTSFYSESAAKSIP